MDGSGRVHVAPCAHPGEQADQACLYVCGAQCIGAILGMNRVKRGRVGAGLWLTGWPSKCGAKQYGGGCAWVLQAPEH